MKEQLIKLANEIGFSAKYTTTSDKFYYLWMCELQKWLMYTYNICVNSYPYQIPELYFGSDIIKFNGITLNLLAQTLGDETYEQALEKGLYEALKLLNIIASEKDAEIFINAITNRREPNEALKKAAKEFKNKL